MGGDPSSCHSIILTSFSIGATLLGPLQHIQVTKDPALPGGLVLHDLFQIRLVGDKTGCVPLYALLMLSRPAQVAQLIELSVPAL